MRFGAARLLQRATTRTLGVFKHRAVITLENLEEMFANMRREAPWNVDADLLWGYFFTDPDPKKLQPVAERLSAAGYRIVKLCPTDDGSTHFLHVERVETHSPKSLHARNTEFYTLASEFRIESYDGMDVGPIAPREDA